MVPRILRGEIQENEMAVKKGAGGRPSKYNKDYAKLAYNYCLLGATDEDLAGYFEVTVSTLNLWKKRHKEFSESLKKGKEIADATIAESLFHRAKGYTHEEEKIFCDKGDIVRAETMKHYPPDTTAGIFWLKNRQSNRWRDRKDHEHSGKDGGPLVLKIDSNLASVL